MQPWQDSLVAYGEAALIAADALTMRPMTATVTTHTVSPVANVVVAANPNRRQVLFHNAAGTVFLKFGLGVTITDYSIRLVANERYETVVNGYAGVITAIRASGTSTLLVTEVTP